VAAALPLISAIDIVSVTVYTCDMLFLPQKTCDDIIAWCESHPDLGRTLPSLYGPHASAFEHETLDDWWPYSGEFNTIPGSHHCQVIMTPPGSIQPAHTDTHGTYRRWRPQAPHHPVLRTWTSLTEPQLGHILMYETHCLYNVPRGQTIVLPKHERHQAVNSSHSMRWSMVVDHELTN